MMNDAPASTPRPTAGSGYDDEISLAALGAVLLRGRATLVRFSGACMVLGGLAGLLSTTEYRATTAFIPQGGGEMSGLAGLAGQFGFQIPGQDATQGPEFYQALLTSREVLVPILDRSYEYSTADGTVSAPLLELGDVDEEEPAEALELGMEWMREEVVGSSIDRNSGILRMSVTTEWPEVSYQIATELLRVIQEFDLNTRRTQAQAEREFLEARVDATRTELRAAEDQLQRFLQQNRQFENSPELQFRYDRLQREVATRQQVYSGLVEAFEQARIQEVRNTPVITVLERPVVPARREPRGTVLKALLGLILGGMLGTAVVFVRHAGADGDDPDTLAFRGEWEDTMADLRRWIPRRRGA
ncbi:MAG: hypothetical protein OEZ65_09260 [Gemmatimonadota bacterium]|nr:hypothetical protein [Gemmatimonadota bacterium]